MTGSIDVEFTFPGPKPLAIGLGSVRQATSGPHSVRPDALVEVAAR